MRLSMSTFLHLRIPFCITLMPLFCFAVSQADGVAPWEYCLLWVILHLLLYPASNGYNSYYDRDTQSIGGLERPPSVTPDLLPVSLFLDALAVSLGSIFGWRFALMTVAYNQASLQPPAAGSKSRYQTPL